MECSSPHLVIPCCFPVFGSPSVWYAHHALPLCSTYFKKCCVTYDENHRHYFISSKKPCQGAPANDLVGAEKAEPSVE